MSRTSGVAWFSLLALLLMLAAPLGQAGASDKEEINLMKKSPPPPKSSPPSSSTTTQPRPVPSTPQRQSEPPKPATSTQPRTTPRQPESPRHPSMGTTTQADKDGPVTHTLTPHQPPAPQPKPPAPAPAPRPEPTPHPDPRHPAPHPPAYAPPPYHGPAPHYYAPPPPVYPRPYPGPGIYYAPAYPAPHGDAIWDNYLRRIIPILRAQVPPPPMGWLHTDVWWQGYLDLDGLGNWLQGGVTASTGYSDLDNATLSALYRAFPLPQPPQATGLRLMVRVLYGPYAARSLQISYTGQDWR